MIEVDFADTCGGRSGGSSMRRPGSEDPHRRERKFQGLASIALALESFFAGLSTLGVALVLFLGFMVLINICLLAKQGDVGKVPQFFGGWGPLKVGEVFFERTDARLVPGCVQLDSAVVYSSKDDLYRNY